MADTTFTYDGPTTGVTLPDGRDITLTPGCSAALPAENAYVKRLVALKRLTDVSPASRAAARTAKLKE